MNRFVLVQQAPPFSIPAQYANYGRPAGSLGAGTLGIVRKFIRPDGSAIAIKKFTHPFENKGRAQLVLRELNMLRTIQHENIVRFIGSYSLESPPAAIESLYHVTEFCGESLSNIIARGQYSMDDVKKWSRELLRAIQHLHSNGVIHRNLHPDNMCIDSNNKLTLLGFGKSRVATRAHNMTADRGTQPYMPVELLVDLTVAYDEKVDIWSVGAIVCEIVTGQPLFTQDEEQSSNLLKLQIAYCGSIDEKVLNKIESQAVVEYLRKQAAGKERRDFIPILREKMLPERTIKDADILQHEHPLRDFIEHTLQFDPEYRMSAERALAHHFLLTLQPWEWTLPEDNDAAMQVLRAAIANELAEAPLPL